MDGVMCSVKLCESTTWGKVAKKVDIPRSKREKKKRCKKSRKSLSSCYFTKVLDLVTASSNVAFPASLYYSNLKSEEVEDENG